MTNEPLQLDEPFQTANAATRTKLADLAERYEEETSRPCADGLTTLRDWMDSSSRFFNPLTCGTCGRVWDYDTPASRCPWESEHPEPDTTVKWTVVGFDTDDGSYAVGSIVGHHNVYGDDDPAGTGTWAEWVATQDGSDGNMPGKIALALREARRINEDIDEDAYSAALADAMLAYTKACTALSMPAQPVVRQGTGNWPSGPVLCEDFDDTGRYAIVWDGGSFWSPDSDENWVDVAAHAANTAAVFAEPINHWAIGLYPRT